MTTTDSALQLHLVDLQLPDESNLILGQSHFIKTVEDVYEAMVNTSNQIEFGIAFCEASGPCLIRAAGNQESLKKAAVENAERVAAGHSFVIVMKQGFPLNVLGAIKQCPEVCSIYCATANPLQVVVAESTQGRGILGVIDGAKPSGVETEQDVSERRQFLRTIGYKL